MTSLKWLAALTMVSLCPFAHAYEGLNDGAKVFKTAGCVNCHTPDLGGGLPLKTNFGVFYTPNISPDRDHGIGNWTDQEFVHALRDGVSPSGKPYYPAFPYHAYSKMTTADILALKNYIFSLPASKRVNKPHQLKFPFNQRSMLWIWQKIYFWNPSASDPDQNMKMAVGPFSPDSQKSAEWNRGAYLVEAVAHCAECHTPRDEMGGLIPGEWMAGFRKGPTGKNIPNISPDKRHGTGKWKKDDWEFFLQSGMTPDGDTVTGDMDEVIQSLSGLSDKDRAAIATYMMSLPPAVEKPVSFTETVHSIF